MKTCFVICPLGDPKSETRIRANTVLDQVIKPVVMALDYKVVRADLTPEHQWTLPEAISKHIFEDDLVIADLTDCNPNVFYELGKRHAWGGHTIHLTQDLGTLPFDVKHHRVIKYDLHDPEALDEVRKELRIAALGLEQVPVQCPFPLTPDKIIELSNATVLVERVDGRRDHYYIAQKIAKSEWRRLFLMQRSSSLILGPEQGWGAEETFYFTLLEKIEHGAEFFHIVSLEGIMRHLGRPQSIFPRTRDALGRLSREDEGVGIKGPKYTWYFKRIPDEEDDHDLKPDRQARTFLVQYPNGETEGVIVVDLGGKQSCFYLKGPMMNDFLNSCLDFYSRCPLLKWSELESVIPNIKTI